MSSIKQIIIIRKDLNMRKGKIASQAAHASMKVLLDLMEDHRLFSDEDEAFPTRKSKVLTYDKGSPLDIWLSGKFTKICVSVNSEEELLVLYKKAQEAGLLCSLIQDSGDTEFHGIPTITCIAVGPAKSEDLDPITGHLKLL